eukprot:CAMPEP_0197443088 /NCGR_PEP_ID=MMETSP1175-20131217/8945_1 /TAXON_ID=1003142 /ORGANISM="Triceratium dubium, Strain CCMP147" /LENGTH=69 /DNA_ID=CAMNT_0042973679 /DNA_START=21 /DNA_END=226 /DNA_ORIENTATION=+
MKASSSYASAALAVVLAATPASAFTTAVVGPPRGSHGCVGTAMNLLPTQGAQLAAAWEAEMVRAAKDST